MRRFTFLLLCFAFATSCQRNAPETDTPEAPTTNAPAPTTFVVGERFGPITSGMTLAEATAAVGAENIIADTLYGPEGIEFPGHKLYPATEREVEAVFYEDETEKRPMVNLTLSREDSPWREATTGLGIGSSLAEVNAINGSPFRFFGFGWDYGGYSTDFGGGKLEDVSLRLEPVLPEDGAMPPNGGYEAILGDQELSSDTTILKNFDIRVAEILIAL